MISAIRSEIRKILTLRSTYVILGIGLLIVVLMNGWVNGYKHPGPINSNFLSGVITSTIEFTSFLLGIVVLLQVSHEYRYNTMYHTMTLARRRRTILLAKAVVASLAMFAGAALFVVVGIASGAVGVAASGDSMGAQSIAWSDMLTRGAVYVWGAGMYALIIAVLLRNQVGAIIVYLFGVDIAEQLLSLLLKSNAGYLPFRALETTMMEMNNQVQGFFSPEKSMVIVLAWIVAAGAAAWLLFEHRDAN